MAKQNRIKKWIADKLGKEFLEIYLYKLDQPDIKNYRPYNKLFFVSTKLVSSTLFILGILSAILIYLEYGNIFNAIALVFTVVWVAVFLRYFLWSVYHYNINFGLTDKDWFKIFEAKERKNLGLPVSEEELEAPQHNPYRSQTFGLPPGTVRGMIAFTLLFGALTLLVVSIGMDEYDLQNSLIRDQFEFFKTAFLMMIAFYFGDKSLKFLQKRWKDPNQGQKKKKTDTPDQETQNNASHGDIDTADEDFMDEDKDFASLEEPLPTTKQNSGFSTLKQKLNQSLGEMMVSEKEEMLEKEYIQIRDSKYQKVLNDEDLLKVITNLKDNDNITLQLPVLKAVIQVESSGRGHLQNGKPKILFEGHKFWYWLKQFKKDPEDFDKGNEDILYEKWTRKFYLGGNKEYSRFDRAMEIHEKSAIYSASWGLFQVLGENLEHNIKSRMKTSKTKANSDLYEDIFDFVEKQETSEIYHLLDFIAFIKTKKIRGKQLIEYISGTDEKKYDWASFAYGYNGSGYQQNQYDEKLKKAYELFNKQKV